MIWNLPVLHLKRVMLSKFCDMLTLLGLTPIDRMVPLSTMLKVTVSMQNFQSLLFSMICNENLMNECNNNSYIWRLYHTCKCIVTNWSLSAQQCQYIMIEYVIELESDANKAGRINEISMHEVNNTFNVENVSIWWYPWHIWYGPNWRVTCFLEILNMNHSFILWLTSLS